MTSLQIVFFSGMAKKSPLENGFHKINHNHGRSRFAFKHSAMMIDKGMRDVRPPITSFKPSMWGDTFSTFTLDHQLQQKYAGEIEALKKEVRSMLMDASSTKLLILIDKLERLGLAYHFETEIENKLKQIYVDQDYDNEDIDLFATTLRFRLLRQHKYQVSCNDFEKFVDEQKKFKESLCSDVAGLLSLYEAAHVRIHDEGILDEAVAFTTHHLSRMLPQLETPLKEKVQHALEFPLQKSVTVLHIRFHISSHEDVDSSDKLLLRLAKLNFNYLQNIYRNELFQLSRWYNEFNLKSKLPYVRDRLAEVYLWGVAYHYEPQYSFIRITIGKLFQMSLFVDDTFDNYATLEEAELFNQAFEGWNTDAIDVLPDHMKILYNFLISYIEDFEERAEKQEKPFVVPYFIKAVKQVCRFYTEEMKWFAKQHTPTFEEYMINSRIKSLIPISLIASTPGVTSSTKDTIDWMLTCPQIMLSNIELGRILNDVASHQRERREGKMQTSIDIYMKDKGVSEQEAVSAFSEMIEESWKQINAEWVKNGMVPKEMLVIFLNVAKICESTYRNKHDGVTNPEKNTTPLIASLLLEQLPLSI